MNKNGILSSIDGPCIRVGLLVNYQKPSSLVIEACAFFLWSLQFIHNKAEASGYLKHWLNTSLYVSTYSFSKRNSLQADMWLSLWTCPGPIVSSEFPGLVQLRWIHLVPLSCSTSQKSLYRWLSCHWLQQDLDQVGKTFTKVCSRHFERISNILLHTCSIQAVRIRHACRQYNCRPWHTGDDNYWTSAEYLLCSMGKSVHV